ncbi:response regulator [Dyadobacter fanqingshengii]|uniref:Response regulator n=1 Tax=Dyadobacter fanqingshengii TaxID=2906443 RepID=A0A9X1T8Z0_9BACT|nr:response regulator [Dyadobacter fanqingshengii]MCF0040176.1 response regulator [Dyadobacter fanqingshengii]MCF2502336.1 response regulator [Dyadobacter fanqingshengii]USJ38073.1 response regulator [Dyadobacter fanqingshengii]
MSAKPIKTIFLADDDADDCMLFEDALREVSTSTELTTANDGVELINLMEAAVLPPPDVIFLDLNMPRKNGFECLEQIRRTKAWDDIPVVIFSTSGQEEMVRKVHERGASYFIRKPGSFLKLKQAIKQILDIDWTKHSWKPVAENFHYQY